MNKIPVQRGLRSWGAECISVSKNVLLKPVVVFLKAACINSTNAWDEKITQ